MESRSRKPRVQARSVERPKVNKPLEKPKPAAPAIAKPKPRVLNVGDEYTSKAERKRGLGDFSKVHDKCLKSMLTRAEELFPPKRILSTGDWLVSHREPGQTFDKYD